MLCWCLFQERRGFLIAWIIITIIMIVFAAFGVIAACTEISTLKPLLIVLFIYLCFEAFV